MITDLQKANMWKRISAGLLDGILLTITVAFAAMLLSMLLGFDGYNAGLRDCYAEYETKFGVSFDITIDEYSALSEEAAALYDQAYAAFSADPEAAYNFNMIIQLSLVIASLSFMLGYLVLEFIIPLLFKNGQTLGKKVFGVGLMRVHGVRINPVCLFIRTMLGKFTIETMVPVLILLMIFWGTIGIVGPVVIAAILLVQLILMIASHTNSLIHDYLANTVAVDMESQMIFDTEDALLEYKKKLHAEESAKQVY